MLLLIFPLLFLQVKGIYVITVYGDVYNNTDFFSRTFPWIVDNIGGEVTVEFQMQGSGRYTVPQMCALEALKMNSFLQAQYLKCEADGYSSEYCLCETGINREEFKQCVNTKGSLASTASAKFAQLGIDFTPIIDLGYNKSTVFGLEDIWFLKKICTIFGDNWPRGCCKPTESNSIERKGIAHFDGLCEDEFPQGPRQPMLTSSSTTPSYTVPHDWEKS